MKAKRKMKLTDTSLLLLITVVVFFAMYIGAILFQGKGFLKPQTFFNILNANAALIIISCGMSLVMITGGIDISVGGVVALVSMCCAVYLWSYWYFLINRPWLWSGSGLSCCLSGYPAIHCFTGGDVLCQGNDNYREHESL